MKKKQNNVLTFLPSYSINYYKLTESDFLILLENENENKKERKKQNKKNKSSSKYLLKTKTVK